jgi:hypothetical protein
MQNIVAGYTQQSEIKAGRHIHSTDVLLYEYHSCLRENLRKHYVQRAR